MLARINGRTWWSTAYGTVVGRPRLGVPPPRPLPRPTTQPPRPECEANRPWPDRDSRRVGFRRRSTRLGTPTPGRVRGGEERAG